MFLLLSLVKNVKFIQDILQVNYEMSKYIKCSCKTVFQENLGGQWVEMVGEGGVLIKTLY